MTHEQVKLTLAKQHMTESVKTSWGDLIAAFQYLKRIYMKEEDRLFSRACCDRTRENGFKLKVERFRLDIRSSFTIRMLKDGHRLLKLVVDALSWETVKVRLDGALTP